jgi:N-acetyl-anhydromuramyl-L-alanine amidase AmpD
MRKVDLSYRTYVSAETTKTNVVLHGSLSRTKHTFTAAQNKETDIADKWNITADKSAGHYIVGRGGEVYSCVPEEYWSNHIGPGRKFNDDNKRTISIFLANELYLEKENSKYYSFGFVKPHNMYQGKVFEYQFKSFNYWADYDTAQIDSVAELLKDVCGRHQIPLSLYRHTTKHAPYAGTRAGIVSCHNLNRESYSLPFPDWVANKLESAGITLVS